MTDIKKSYRVAPAGAPDRMDIGIALLSLNPTRLAFIAEGQTNCKLQVESITRHSSSQITIKGYVSLYDMTIGLPCEYKLDLITFNGQLDLTTA